jgi:hypothetical protein
VRWARLLYIVLAIFLAMFTIAAVWTLEPG